MSIANFWNQQQDQIIFPSLDVINLEINDVPFSGGGSGEGSNLQDVLTTGNDAGGLDAVNIGNLKCTKYLEIGNAISNTSQMHLCYGNGTSSGNNIQIVGSSAGLQVQQYTNGSLSGNGLVVGTDGTCNLSYNGVANVQQIQSNNTYTTGRIFDTTFNKPTLANVLALGNDGNGKNIANVNSISCSSLTVNGLPVSGGGASDGTLGVITFPTVNNVTFPANQAYVVPWSTENQIAQNCFNTANIIDVFTINGQTGQISFSNSTSIIVNMVGTVVWAPAVSNSIRAINIIRTTTGRPDQTIYTSTMYFPANLSMTHAYDCTFVVNDTDIITVKLFHTDTAPTSIVGGGLTLTRFI